MKTPRPSRRIVALDSLPGPALPLSPTEVEQMARVVARRATGEAGAAPSRGLWRPWRIGVGVTIVAGSAAALHWGPGRSFENSGRVPAHGTASMAASFRPPQPPELLVAAAEPVSSLDAEPSAPASGIRSASGDRSSSPARLLAHANELRRTQQWAAATAVYERIIGDFPGSAEAYSARVAAASLRLEKLGDPAAARQLYRQALRSRGAGALDEEILLGLGRADRAAGDPRAERATLERLLAEHPRTVHAPYARARLRQLAAESR